MLARCKRVCKYVSYLFHRESCWLCDAMFASWAALKKHLISPAYVRMNVICPWCTGKENTFTRIADMKMHAMNLHKAAGVKDTHFSRGVGFYFAKYPADYIKIVDYVVPYQNDNACAARSFMRKWAETMPRSMALMERLNRGWKEEKKTGETTKETEKRLDDIEKDTEKRSEDMGKNREKKLEDRRKETEQTRRSRDKSEAKDQRKVVIERRDERRGMEQKEQEERKDKERSGGEVEINERGDNRSKERKDKERSGGEVEINERRDNRSKERVDTGESDRTESIVRGRSAERRVDNSDRAKPGSDREGKKREHSADQGPSKKAKCLNTEEEEEEDFESYNDDIELGASASSSDSDSDTDDEGASSVQSRVSRDCGRHEDLRLRATKILMRGAMPMCPPAQRDWAQVTESTVEGKIGNLVWPPKNWRSLRPDQKLLAHEYAAMFLEQERGKGFPADLSRRALLDKYNFLALEGAARPKAESAKHKVDAKIRYYNYEFVRNVAKGVVPDSRIAQGIITSLERVDRWTDTDYFTNNLDDVNIKLRV